MKHLIIGKGEIGKAIQKVLNCDIRDISEFEGGYDVIHICFPYSFSFIDSVKKYKEIHKAEYIVIHSTVPVGTTRKLHAIHSPVNGKHPNLYQSIKTFTKFFAGRDAWKIAQEFKEKGVPVKVMNKPENTEAGKLWSLNIYGLNVIIMKEIHEYCRKKSLDFKEVYNDYVEMYNDGYQQMGLPQFKMYNLEFIEGKIGGHCIIQNMDNLDHKLAELLQVLNDNLED